ncbi:MAG: hypothetical protein AB7F96_07015 [Beijerinckiaceae bacterium]
MRDGRFRLRYIGDMSEAVAPLAPRQTATPPADAAGGGGAGLLAALFIGPAIILAWVIVSALAYIFFEPGETVMVFAPQRAAVQAAASADAQILSTGQGFIVARSDKGGYVRRLYKNGAWLVLPTSEMMCGHPGIVRKIATGK